MKIKTSVTVEDGKLTQKDGAFIIEGATLTSLTSYTDFGALTSFETETDFETHCNYLVAIDNQFDTPEFILTVTRVYETAVVEMTIARIRDWSCDDGLVAADRDEVGNIKINWDGCGHFYPSDYYHLCGIHYARMHAVSLEAAFALASRLLTSTDARDFGIEPVFDPDFQAIEWKLVCGTDVCLYPFDGTTNHRHSGEQR